MRRDPRSQARRSTLQSTTQSPIWAPESLIQALRPTLEGRKQADVFPGVSRELLQEIIKLSGEGARELENFDGLRLDLNGQRLTVQYPCRWDYIPRIVFGRLIKQGAFEPSRPRNGRALLDVGCTEYAQYIRLSDGLKSPVYSIYESMIGEGEPMGPPTLVAEVGYSEDVGRLENDAARYISKSKGLIQAVITLELGFGVSNGVMKLQKATWSHWEAEDEACHRLRDLDAAMQCISLNAVGASVEETWVAQQTATYQIWPIPQYEGAHACINILDRHVQSEYMDGSSVAVEIPLRLVRDVLLQYCEATEDGWVHQPEEEKYP